MKPSSLFLLFVDDFEEWGWSPCFEVNMDNGTLSLVLRKPLSLFFLFVDGTFISMFFMCVSSSLVTFLSYSFLCLCPHQHQRIIVFLFSSSDGGPKVLGLCSCFTWVLGSLLVIPSFGSSLPLECSSWILFSSLIISPFGMSRSLE